MRIFPALYTAEVYDSVHGRMEKIKGITFAEDFSEAMKNIEGYYGEELNSIFLELQEEQSIWELERIKGESF